MVELCLLRSVQIHFRSLEIGTRVHHGPIQPERIELVRNVVMKMNGIAILRLRMHLDSRCIRGSKQPLGMVGGRVQHPQAQGRESRQEFLSERHLQRIQVILDAERCEEIPLDIQFSPEVRIGQRERIVPEHGGPNGLRAAEHQREGRIRT